MFKIFKNKNAYKTTIKFITRNSHQERVDQITAAIKSTGNAVPKSIKFTTRSDIRKLNREMAQNYKFMPGGRSFYFIIVGSLAIFTLIWNETQKLRRERTGNRYRNFEAMTETARREILGQTKLSEVEKESMDKFEAEILKEMKEAEKKRLNMIQSGNKLV